MIVECLSCNKRYSIIDSPVVSESSCSCGKIIPAIKLQSYSQVVNNSKGQIECSVCNRKYDVNFRNNTKLACNCGNLMTIIGENGDRSSRGRRDADHEAVLLKKELQGLIDTSLLIHSSISDLNNLLSLIVKVTTEMMHVEGASVILKDDVKRELIFFVADGKSSPKLQSFRLNIGEGIVGSCIQNIESIIVNDVEHDKRFSNRVDSDTGFKTKSLLCVPLVVDNDCIGALELVNKNDNLTFTDRDLWLTEAIASHIAVAIRTTRLTEQKIKSEKLAAIGQAVTGVAHCVKNMLNGLSGGMYILKKDVKKLSTDFKFKGLEMVDRNMNRLKDLVFDMLSYSKERKPEIEETNINELLESIYDLMLVKADENKVQLVFNPDNSLDKIFIDPKGIYRSVLNLVSNAIDASIRIENSKVTLSSLKSEDNVIIKINDQGTGIDEQFLNTIFEPFFSKKGSKGTGLGLSVTKKIIEEHNGKIVVSSKINEGSTFEIMLPISINKN